jgi:26S proteasome regulatory subunit T6
MDEIDSIGQARGRGGGCGGGDSEVQRTMLELLNQLDGFDPAQNIKVIMATNRIDILDPALLRAGRIDCTIECPNPNIENHMVILKVHSRKMNFLHLQSIARKMPSSSGTKCKAVFTEAGCFRYDSVEFMLLKKTLKWWLLIF